jgi:hypothetical protein
MRRVPATPEAAQTIRTTVDLPADLWRAVKLRATYEPDKSLRAVMLAALQLYLATPPTQKAR